jgi:hypothetical protein
MDPAREVKSRMWKFEKTWNIGCFRPMGRIGIRGMALPDLFGSFAVFYRHFSEFSAMNWVPRHNGVKQRLTRWFFLSKLFICALFQKSSWFGTWIPSFYASVSNMWGACEGAMGRWRERWRAMGRGRWRSDVVGPVKERWGGAGEWATGRWRSDVAVGGDVAVGEAWWWRWSVVKGWGSEGAMWRWRGEGGEGATCRWRVRRWRERAVRWRWRRRGGEGRRRWRARMGDEELLTNKDRSKSFLRIVQHSAQSIIFNNSLLFTFVANFHFCPRVE